MKELLLSIDVQCLESVGVKGKHTGILMIPFTGRAYGEYFNGEIIGTGTDTQKYDVKSGECRLSARYMLQGIDKEGNACRIFIENSLQDEEGWHPMVVTDSTCLCQWEQIPLIATVNGTQNGVLVQIYCEKGSGNDESD